jgi:hypothetical protein
MKSSNMPSSQNTTNIFSVNPLTPNSKNPINELTKIVENDGPVLLTVKCIKECHQSLWWGGNGVGDRFAGGGKFNYSVIQTNKGGLYSENDDDVLPDDIRDFIPSINGRGIIALYIYSKRKNIEKRPIRSDISREIKKSCCVSCGSHTDIVCDHKNDLYNDPGVLSLETQTIDDFQALCNHCNLQKRQVCKTERATGILYSVNNLGGYENDEFPWEPTVFDEKDINCKFGSYWFDISEWRRKYKEYNKYGTY